MPDPVSTTPTESHDQTSPVERTTSQSLLDVQAVLDRSQAMTARIEEARKSMSSLLASCQKTRESCEKVVQDTGNAHRASEDLDKKWDEFKAKFEEANRRLIGAIGSSLGHDTTLFGPGGGSRRSSTDDDDELPGMDELTQEQREGVFCGGASSSDNISLKTLCHMIRTKRIKNIAVMAGAGISVSAGIPDFRSKDGLYAKLKREYNMPNPQLLFSIDYFLENPNPFCERSLEMLPGKYRPTPTHCFLRLLNEKGILKRLYTQNIDTLEQVAGLPAEKCVFAHGSYSDAHCVECGNQMLLPEWRKCIEKQEVPRCGHKRWSLDSSGEPDEKKDSFTTAASSSSKATIDENVCNGLVKPDIVFFGEELPQRFSDVSKADFGNPNSSQKTSNPVHPVDCLLVLGTSLQVSPFNSLVARPELDVPRVLVNREKAGTRDSLYGGFEFDHKDNYRDLFLQGDCDDVVLEMCREIGWDKELDTLQKEIGAADGWDFLVKNQPKGGNKFQTITY